MRYVQRDAEGRLIGHFAHPNAGAEEEVPDDHHEIVEWERARAALRLRPSPLEERLRRIEADIAELKAARRRKK